MPPSDSGANGAPGENDNDGGDQQQQQDSSVILDIAEGIDSGVPTQSAYLSPKRAISPQPQRVPALSAYVSPQRAAYISPQREAYVSPRRDAYVSPRRAAMAHAVADADHLDKLEASEAVTDITSFQDVDLSPSPALPDGGSGESSESVPGADARRPKRFYYCLPMVQRYRYNLAGFLVLVFVFGLAIGLSVSSMREGGGAPRSAHGEMKIDDAPGVAYGGDSNDKDFDVYGLAPVEEGEEGWIEEGEVSYEVSYGEQYTDEDEELGDLPPMDGAEEGVEDLGDPMEHDATEGDEVLDLLMNDVADGGEIEGAGGGIEVLGNPMEHDVAEGHEVMDLLMDNVADGGEADDSEGGYEGLGDPLEHDVAESHEEVGASHAAKDVTEPPTIAPRADGDAAPVGSPSHASPFAEDETAPDDGPRWFHTSHAKYQEFLDSNADHGVHAYHLAGLFCHSQSLSLCPRAEYCPSGRGDAPYLGGPPNIRFSNALKRMQWAPVLSSGTPIGGGSQADWVQVGEVPDFEGGSDSNDHATCWTYKEWMGEDVGDIEEDVGEDHRRWMLCCPMPDGGGDGK